VKKKNDVVQTRMGSLVVMEHTSVTIIHFVVNSRMLLLFVLVLRMIPAVKGCVFCVFVLQLCIDREKTTSSVLKKSLNFKNTIVF